ncbi:MAG: GNAT family N-acetyltransferase [Ignavibacteria bacterium]|nr:GNAT family N-acetyltransferase [Ignavibacteria bacterium]
MGKIESKKLLSKGGETIIIRTAEPADAESLIYINMKIVNEKLYMLRQPREAVYTKDGEIKKIKDYLNSTGSLYIVAEVNGKVVGYLDFQNGGFKRTQHSGSFSLYILMEWREKGIGNLLLQALTDWAEGNPVIEKITLAVFSNNERAKNLYKKWASKKKAGARKT